MERPSTVPKPDMAGREAIGQMSFAELVRTHVDRIYRYLLVLVGDTEAARELTQETFLRVHRAMRQGSEGPRHAGYLFAAARNGAISRLRRRKTELRHVAQVPPERLEELAQADPGAHPARRLEQRAIREDLRTALAGLPEKQREVFVLSELEGFSYEQIARVVGCSMGTVASRKHHAVRGLRRALTEAGYGF